MATRQTTAVARLNAQYSILPHPESKRLKSVRINRNDLASFFEATRDISVRTLEYVPYSRFNLTEVLLRVLGQDFLDDLRRLVVDRSSGGFFLDVSANTTEFDDILKCATAIAYGLGMPDTDVLSGKFYARLVVKGTEQPAERSNLFQPYLTFRLHTDGAASRAETTDWLVFAKTSDRHAEGGRSRLLHLDDWEDLQHFTRHPLGRNPFRIALPPATDPRQQQWGNNVTSEPLDRPLFFDWNGQICVRFADQFIHPGTLSEAAFLRDLTDSFERSAGVESATIPLGTMMFLNNNYWLHGRGTFQQHPDLERELIRMRGRLHQV
jgi:glutarate dioxygenase